MKNIFLALISILMCLNETNAQWRPGTITNANINQIYFNSGLNAYYALGNKGYLIYTVSGQPWRTIYVPDSSDLQAMDFPSTYTGYIGTQNGLMKTTSFGSAIRWVKIPSYGMTDITGIDFISNQMGWVCSGNGTIGRTIDGGMHWDTTFFANKFFNKIVFNDFKNGWAVGSTVTNSLVMKTTDGGITWQEETGISSNSYCVDVEFKDPYNGYITLGDGSVYKTTNGGNTWTLISTIPGSTILNVAFSDLTSYAYAVTNSGIYKSTDTGITWQLSSSIQAMSICFIEPINIVVGGNFGILNATDDGGSNWSSSNSSILSGENLYGIKFYDAFNGFIVGNGGLIRHSNDGGHTWLDDNSPVNTPLYAIENTISHVWAVGLNGKIAKRVGSTWNVISSGTTETLLSIDFIDDFKGVVVGTNGKIIRTTDGGLNWTSISSGTTNNLRSVCFVDANVGYIAGLNNTILKTINGGLSWTSISQPGFSSSSYLSIAFSDPLNGIACGLNGDIIKTSDGGNTWMYVSNPRPGFHLNYVHFSSPTEGWIVGNEGTLLHSLDGGNTWFNNSLNNYSIQPLNAITSINGKLFAVGNGMSYFQYDDNCSGASAPVSFTESEELNNCVGSGESSILLASGKGTVSWYDAPTGGNYLGSGNYFITPSNLTANSTYYAQDSTCITSSRTPITVSVSNVIPTATISVQGNLLTTQETGVLYQWINCDENTFVSGETAQNFTATSYANYAVTVNLNGCITQSTCLPVSFVGINEPIKENSIDIYPNPSSTEITIKTPENISGKVKIVSSNGVLVYEEKLEDSLFPIDISTLNNGLYIISIETEKEIISRNFIKSN